MVSLKKLQDVEWGGRFPVNFLPPTLTSLHPVTFHKPITLLGSSGFSARLAAALGLPFAFAAHFAPDALYAAAQFYRERFQPSEVLQTPYLLIAAQVIAAETDAAARRLFTTPQQRFLRLIRGSRWNCCLPLIQWSPYGMTGRDRLWKAD